LDDSAERDYPGVEDDVDDEDNDEDDDDDDDDGHELEDYEAALDETGLENPLWDRALGLPRPRDRRPRSLRSKRKKKKGGSKRRPRKGGKKKSSRRKGGKKTKKRHGRPPRKSG